MTYLKLNQVLSVWFDALAKQERQLNKSQITCLSNIGFTTAFDSSPLIHNKMNNQPMIYWSILCCIFLQAFRCCPLQTLLKCFSHLFERFWCQNNFLCENLFSPVFLRARTVFLWQPAFGNKPKNCSFCLKSKSQVTNGMILTLFQW